MNTTNEQLEKGLGAHSDLERARTHSDSGLPTPAPAMSAVELAEKIESLYGESISEFWSNETDHIKTAVTKLIQAHTDNLKEAK